MVALNLGHGGIKFRSWWHWIDLMVGPIEVVVCWNRLNGWYDRGWNDLMVGTIEVGMT